MAKAKRVSLEALTAQSVAAEESNNVVTLQRDNVVTSKRPQQQHTSLYLSAEVRKTIREIAYQFDRKPHDLYMEGIDLMLAKYGKATSKELAGK